MSVRTTFRSPVLRALLCLAVAAIFWLPVLHIFFEPKADSADVVRGLLDYQSGLWADPTHLAVVQGNMRRTNPEWDFMSRTFFALSLANLALREPANADRYLATMDHIIDDTLEQERLHGKYYFLMDYAHAHPFVNPGKRSVFEDGEIALMLAARRLVREKDAYREPMHQRIEWVEQTMRDGPVLCGESYPDECWMFCNTLALAAMRCSDALDGTEHSAFVSEWIENAKKRLTNPATGLLISSFNLRGDVQDGPEGSTIWMATHCLQVVDPAYAKEQYLIAKKLLSRNLLGFGYASEWPKTFRTNIDVDSGLVIPLLDASPSSSGFAILGAATFGDFDFLNSLRTSLDFSGFPQHGPEGLHYCVGNLVGDSVLLYALVQGPLWEKVNHLRPPGVSTPSP